MGLPGAGKSTAGRSVFNALKPTRKAASAATAHTAALAVEFGRQTLEFWRADSSVVIGHFSNEERPELAGSDNYSPPRRTRIKTLIADLAASQDPPSSYFMEGVSVCQRPW